MILRAAIVVLLVLNIGIAAWWMGGGNVPRERAAAPLPADAPSLHLVAEVAAARPDIAASVPAAPTVSVDASAPTVAEAIGQCLRFGPFADAAARDAARAGLAASASVLLPRDVPGKSARGWKVYLPAYATREEAKAMGERIKAAGIRDWYVMGEGDAANSIALGRYGSEDAARRREAELRAKGFPAQAEPLGDGAPQWWLDAQLKPGVEPAALAGVAAPKRIDCASLR